MADAAPELTAAGRIARGLWPVVKRLEGALGKLPEVTAAAAGLGRPHGGGDHDPIDVALAATCALAATRVAADLRGESHFDAAIAREHMPLADSPLGQTLLAALASGAMDDSLGSLAGESIDVDTCAHLYNALLKRSDPGLVRERGIYYTPKAVARHIVEHADRKLAELSPGGGLLSLSPARALVDPATGTGIFLCEVVECAHRRAGLGGGDPVELVRSMLPALRAYELLPVPRALCRWQLSLSLLRLGGKVQDANLVELSGESFLSMVSDRQDDGGGDVVLVIGNPPYRRGSDNNDPRVRAMLADYRRGLDDERNLQPLSDDYIKFVRAAQCLLALRPDGVLAMVTNHAFLRGRLHRRMRESLRATFGRVEVLDLHGSVRVREADTARDGNVFEIGQGVCVLHAVRGLPVERHGVLFGELRGERADKLDRLRTGRLPTPVALICAAPYHPFAPLQAVPPEYAHFIALPSLFDFHSVAAKPGDDRLLVGYESAALLEGLVARRAELAGPGGENGATEAARKLARRPAAAAFDPDRVVPYGYRPFDVRVAYHDEDIWTRPVRRLREAMGGGPVMLTTRIVKDSSFSHVFAFAVLPDVIALSSTSSVNAYAFPRAALRPAELLSQLEAPMSDDEAFAFIYAVLHSPGYRRRYFGAMRNDFPRIPVPRDPAVASALAAVGQRLLDLHLGPARPRDADGVSFHDGGDRTIRRVAETRKTLSAVESGAGRLHINDTSYFAPVPLPVWECRIGAYRVAHKWLDDRRRAGRALDDSDIIGYIDMLARLGETLTQQAAIDAAIDAAGGYPDAFR